ncbi:MAG: response regulator transcription factor [Tepidimonas sp.]|uniref:response regulator transcription factor n=1 Tax=Tepidimonas sp. TaxID=2002775 RepID=UPI00298F04C2|nr:response regulator transcription factor [Tepidimonas sp.]MCS6810720.1 response regulator transcription factor [Tepidimonas sp.]MCX7742045.1 response regulator transcription factor [Tepidimonas sp.]MDW8336613.1 response regulator transcription factor [Tepidimonas sp.]
MKLLLVEDDESIGEGLRLGLQGAGWRVLWVTHASAAQAALAAHEFDGVLLDLGLPDRDGLELLAALDNGSRPRPPVLILSARAHTRDKVAGLNGGADDYLTKPFDFDELLARLHALQRRAAGRPQPVLRFGALAIDPLRREVRLGGHAIDLTPREFDLLHVLAQRPGVVRSLDWLHDRLYDDHDVPASNAVQVHLHHLRRKLGAAWIENIRGVGYRFRPDGTAP